MQEVFFKLFRSGGWDCLENVDALPVELRQPLALSAVEELTSPKIAALLGIPEGTVRQRILRARQILKQKLEAMLERRNARP